MFDDAVIGDATIGICIFGAVDEGVAETATYTQWSDQCKAGNDWFEQQKAITSTVRCNDGS